MTGSAKNRKFPQVMFMLKSPQMSLLSVLAWLECQPQEVPQRWEQQ